MLVGCLFASLNLTNLGLIDGIEKKKKVFMEMKPHRGDMLVVEGRTHYFHSKPRRGDMLVEGRRHYFKKAPSGRYVGSRRKKVLFPKSSVGAICW